MMPSRSIAPFTEAEHKVFCRPKLAILVNVGGWAQARRFTNGEEEEMGLTKVVPFLVEDELMNLGADGQLITGQNPA